MTPPPSPSPQTPPLVLGWKQALQGLWIPVLMALVCWMALGINHLLFHTLAELFSIVVATVALVLASTSLQFTRNQFVIYIAVSIGWCGVLDLTHLLALKELRLLPLENTAPADQLWLVARSLQALALVTAPLWLVRSVGVAWLHFGFGALVLLLLWLVFTNQLPLIYLDSFGLYATIVVMGVAIGLFWHHRAQISQHLLTNLLLAAAFMMAANLAFVRYPNVYVEANHWGHIFKIFSYWYVYRALVQSALNEPFDLLTRTASAYDAVPDPTLVIGADGLIRQANQAAAQYCQRPIEALLHQSSHSLFHDAATAPEHCPVCQHLQSRQHTGLALEIQRHQDQRTVECILAPLHIPGDGQGYVQVVRDITERQRLVAEREALVFNLGERIKELRCLHAIANLVETPGLQPSTLLAGVAQLLPPAFLVPEQIQVALHGEYGYFGSPWPAHPPARRLERPLRINGEIQGWLLTWYPDAPTGQEPPHFLADEGLLLDSVSQQVADCIERLQAAAKVQRLSNFYAMLSATNRAVVYSKNRDELLNCIYQALVEHGTFPMLFLALRPTPHTLQLECAHGIPAHILPNLAALIANNDSMIHGLLPQLVDGQVQVYDMPPKNTAQPDAWLDFLHQQQVRQRGLLPLFSDGQLLGVFGLYSNSHDTFAHDEMLLLNEMASDLSFALRNLSSAEHLRQAQAQASLSEHRFSELFQASPSPMLIFSLHSSKTRTLNQALQQWLGYDIQDIPSIDAWFQRTYHDALIRAELFCHWNESIVSARTGTRVESPEMVLHCKDGSTRIARGTMAVVGDEVIIAWTDLTDIRSSERTLLESEKRFRSMVEQTIIGVYVRRGGRIIYVNPSYCTMMGWAEQELLNNDILSFTTTDPENLETIYAAWDKLEKGERNVSYNVPMRCKDGKIIALWLNANQIIWDDGQEATIVMAQDVTDRKKAEDEIAGYVRQLEASMKGTLQAVSNMVEMRDPYTAGHERRVGLIVGAIGRQMGWSEQRCSTLELVGLVHDIGKIAVPAEILTKPSRLSELEMEIVKCHAEAGYEILKDVHFPMPVADIIRQHHERMDGSGYPQGLRGDEIMPEARIIAVADVLESMAADRPYRAALGLTVALAEIVRGRGNIYDPVVADAIVALVQEQGYTLPD